MYPTHAIPFVLYDCRGRMLIQAQDGVWSYEDVYMVADTPYPVVMEEVTDPEALAKAQAQWERFDRNFAWLKAHAQEVYTRHRGKCLCIAGEELFVADTPEEALALAQKAHPEDNGFFLHDIPQEKLARIYAH
jgi:hypothetical protein